MYFQVCGRSGASLRNSWLVSNSNSCLISAGASLVKAQKLLASLAPEQQMYAEQFVELYVKACTEQKTP